MTKKILLASAALVLMAAQAQAGGEWSGIYMGGHAGGTWGDVDVTTKANTTAFFDASAGNVLPFSPDGVLGGAQIGYNFQWSSFLLGVEGSWSATDFEQGKRTLDDASTVSATWLATATMRAGYAIAPQSLVYLKGGYAAAKLEHALVDTTGPNTGAFANEDTYQGWVAGAGFEHLLSEDVSLGVEYTYADLDGKDYTVVPVPATLVTNTVDSKIETVTLRLNWHWNP